MQDIHEQQFLMLLFMVAAEHDQRRCSFPHLVIGADNEGFDLSIDVRPIACNLAARRPS